MNVSWILTISATINNLVVIWLYGNGHRKAPVLALFGCSPFIAYNIINEQWPMMLPTALTIAVNIRNLKVMKNG